MDRGATHSFKDKNVPPSLFGVVALESECLRLVYHISLLHSLGFSFLLLFLGAGGEQPPPKKLEGNSNCSPRDSGHLLLDRHLGHTADPRYLHLFLEKQDGRKCRAVLCNFFLSNYLLHIFPRF